MISRLLASIFLVLAVVTLLVKCSASSKTQHNYAIDVSTARVVKKTVPYIVELAGNTEAYTTVSIQSLVSGTLLKIAFEDGQNVKKGDLLFQIDDRSFHYQLAEVEANLLRDKTSLEHAVQEEKRYKALLEHGAVSKEQYEQMLTNRDALKADVTADEAAVLGSKLQIEYSKIQAPISGKLGESLVKQGDLISNSSPKAMAVINRISPIYVSFFVPEQYIAAMKKSHSINDLSISLKTSDGTVVENGQVGFIDNAVDLATGTIKIKAIFPNLDESLWPGQFVKAKLNLYSANDALVIPAKAVQVNQSGQYVFVVSDDDTVTIRPIVVDFSVDDYAMIKSGLKEGEIVVTTGQLRLIGGSKVNRKT